MPGGWSLQLVNISTVIVMKTQLLIGHNIKIQRSTVNIFIFDKSSAAVVLGLVVNIP